MTQILEFPGFVDVHVHFRDPGATDAEDRHSGSLAAHNGGFAAVVTMPNTNPAGDNIAWLRDQIEDATLPVKIFPSACITAGRLGRQVAPLEELAEAGAAFFTDDGSYVADDKVMEEAMKRAAKLNRCICDHAMDPKLQKGGVIRECALAHEFSLPIISVETETAAIRRDISLCRVTGAHLHIQHISTAAGVELVRDAQKEGLPVTAEACPHHLLFSCDELTADDANFKMAPPLGNREDRAELRRAVKNGVLMFATDHAPHCAETKSRGFRSSANGIIGLEAAIGATYQAMVVEEGMTVEKWAEAWWKMPRQILPEGYVRQLDLLPKTHVEINGDFRINASRFASKSRNTPYDGMIFAARPVVL